MLSSYGFYSRTGIYSINTQVRIYAQTLVKGEFRSLTKPDQTGPQ